MSEPVPTLIAAEITRLNHEYNAAVANGLIIKARWIGRMIDVLERRASEVKAADEAEMVDCAICGHYSAKGVEVHQVCLDMLSRRAALATSAEPSDG